MVNRLIAKNNQQMMKTIVDCSHNQDAVLFYLCFEMSCFALCCLLSSVLICTVLFLLSKLVVM